MGTFYKSIGLAAVTVLLFSQVALAAGQNVQENVRQRTKQDIIQRFEQQYKPMQVSFDYMRDASIYAEAPNMKPPYSPGKLKEQYIVDGIRAVNFMRYLAGVPDDVTPDWSLERQEQAAALVNAVNDELTHFPVQPSDMDSALFQLGYDGTSSSNLFAGNPTLYSNVLGYMSDSDPTNIDRIGHRRWIINPPMMKTMFGFVHTEESYPYSALYAFDRERPESVVQYDFVSWPSAGYFPEEVFAPDDAWSVSPNPDKYDNTRVANIKVTLTRVRDGKQWEFDQGDKDTSGKYFNVQTSYYGIPYCIIFRPDQVGTFEEDDRFQVEITGIYDTGGNETKLSFETTFFNIVTDVELRMNIIRLEPGETLKLGYGNSFEGDSTLRPVITSADKTIVSVDSEGKITAHKPGETTVRVGAYLEDPRTVYIRVIEPKPNNKVSAWAADDYKRAKENGIVDMSYDPSYQSPISRHAFAVAALKVYENVLGRYVVMMDTPFTDVDDIRISKAFALGLIRGTSESAFSPWDTITRQEAATLLLNIYRKVNEQKTGAVAVLPSMSISKFSDDDKISSWAKENVYTAVGLGLLNGVGAGKFDPLGKLTHEQAYVILEKVYELLDEQQDEK